MRPDQASLIPCPRCIEWTDAYFDLSKPLRIVCDRDIASTAVRLAQVLRECGAGEVALVQGDPADPGDGGVGITIGEVQGADGETEAYGLEVGSKCVIIRAPEEVGVFWAIQTIRQLSTIIDGRPVLTGCSITDWPAYRWRGLMLDPARNFWSLGLIKEQIETLAKYKMNVLHIHLTDNTAWRIEIRKHPYLTNPEFQTRQPGSFYTQSDLRDLIEFARDRHIMVIPEIDMPGHSQAFGNATRLDMQSDEGMAILEDILAEVCALFNAPYIHLGVDEVHITNSEFVPTMADKVRSYGKEAIIWLPGSYLDDNAIYELWSISRPPLNARCIDARPYYINLLEPLSGVVSTFNMQVCGADTGSDRLLGAEAPLWHDRRAESEMDVMRMNPLYPVMLTLSERAWRGGGYPEVESRDKLDEPGSRQFRDFREFEDRLICHRDRMRENGTSTAVISG